MDETPYVARATLEERGSLHRRATLALGATAVTLRGAVAVRWTADVAEG